MGKGENDHGRPLRLRRLDDARVHHIQDAGNAGSAGHRTRGWCAAVRRLALRKRMDRGGPPGYNMVPIMLVPNRRVKVIGGE